MSDLPPNTGPSHETLRRLAEMLPGIIKGAKQGKIFGKGTPTLVRSPSKVCKVCGLLFDKAWLPAQSKVQIQPDFCKTCKPLLDAGYVALMCGDKYALVKAASLSDWAGTIKHISPRVMANVERQLGLSKRRINGAHKEIDGDSVKQA